MKMIIRHASTAVLLFLSSAVVVASDVDELTALLDAFLANSHTAAAHQAFWADDLVYTSSAGLRFGKADILASFDGAPAEDVVPETEYAASETDIRIYDDTAIVAFKLVGTPVDSRQDRQVEYYFNTGTFLRRNGGWQAIAWQATRIPAVE